MKTCVAILSLMLASCAGWSIHSPYGEINTDKEGNTIYTPPPKPIIINSKK